MPGLPDPSAPRPRWATSLLPGLVFLWVFVAFGPALSADFVDFDDGILVVENEAFRGLSPGHIRWMFSATLMGHYQPLTWLSYAIDWTLSGPPLDPARFHLTSLLLHSFNAVLLYFFAWRVLALAGVGGRQPAVILPTAAAAAAVLWGVHPLRVESVAWVTERRDVLSGSFLLMAAIAYLRAVRPGGPGLASPRWFVASIALLALSLLSKAWGITFFAAMLIMDAYPLRRLPMNPFLWLRREHRGVLVEKIPFVALGMACGGVAKFAHASIGAARTLTEWDFPSRIAQASQGTLWYLYKTLWPTRLAALYELPPSLDPLAPWFIACAVMVLGAGALLWTFRRRIPGLAAAAAAYFITVLPVLGFTQAGDQLWADRYSYLAMIGLTIAAAGGLAMLAGPLLSRPVRLIPVGAGLAALLAVLFVATWRQTTVWENATTLWAHAIRVRPRSIMAHNNYGANLRVIGDDAGAIRHFRYATELRPEDGRGWHQLAIALRDQGDIEGAEFAYRRAVRHLTQAYMPLVNLGKLLTNDLGRPDEGLEMYRLAVQDVENLRPGSKFTAIPYLVLGRALAVRGRPDEAREILLRAINHPKTEPKVREEVRKVMREFGLDGR